jgi:hypothetical protein
VTTGFPHVDLIARAAKLMRERAEAANTDSARTPYSDQRIAPVDPSQWGGMVDNYLGGPIGAHCASWTPATALAVASWLDIGANPYACIGLAPMVAVARAYLAEPDAAPHPSTRCTGLTARWCPVHGKCICPEDGIAELHIGPTCGHAELDGHRDCRQRHGSFGECPVIPTYTVPVDECDHGRWNPDSRQCLDCGHISDADRAAQ